LSRSFLSLLQPDAASGFDVCLVRIADRMNDDRAQLAKGIISAPYIKQALEGTRSRSALLATLLSQRRLLPNGLDDFSIQMIMMELASMDSNNFLSNAGMGEREGRIFSAIVRARCWSMSHGVGRR
jgi:O-phospho-L-seryl-tRNASec:L-selenocysteinyl-tRNA synthase